MSVHHLYRPDFHDQILGNRYMDHIGFVFPGFRYGDYRAPVHFFALSVATGYGVSLGGEREHFVGKFHESLIGFSPGEVHHEAGEPRTFGYAESAAGAFAVVDPGGVVDVVEGEHRSGGAAGVARVAGNALGAFDEDEPILFAFPEFPGRSYRSGAFFREDAAVIEFFFVRHDFLPPTFTADFTEACPDFFAYFSCPEVFEAFVVEGGALFVFFRGAVAEAGRGGESRYAPFHHGGGGFFDARGVSGYPDVRVGGAHEGVPTGYVAAELGDEFHGAVRLPEEFTGGGEAYGETDDVAVHFFGRPHGFEAVVDFLDEGSFDEVVSEGFRDGVLEKDGNSHAPDFGGVDPVASDFGKGFEDAYDLNSRLHELIADDEADVAGSYHEDFVPRGDSVDVHEGLDGSGSVDSGKVVVGEGDESFLSSRGHDDFPGLDPDVFVFSHHVADYSVFFVVSRGGSVGENFDFARGLVTFEFFEEDVRYGKSPGARMFFFGTEEFVGLLDELPSEFEVTVQNRDFRSKGGRFYGRREPRRASADDEYFRAFHGFSSP
jgi:hypothetical protein